MTARVFPLAPSFTGYSSHQSVGTLDTTVFVADGHAYTVNVLALSTLGNALGIRVTPDLDTADTSRWILLVDGLEFAFEDASISPEYEDNETLVDPGGLGRQRPFLGGRPKGLPAIARVGARHLRVGEDVSTGVLRVTDAQ